MRFTRLACAGQNVRQTRALIAVEQLVQHWTPQIRINEKHTAAAPSDRDGEMTATMLLPSPGAALVISRDRRLAVPETRGCWCAAREMPRHRLPHTAGEDQFSPFRVRFVT